MRGLVTLCLTAALANICIGATSKSARSVLLSNVESLTLRDDQKTTARRLAPIDQLKCVGGTGKGLYKVDVMRCKNSGADYDADNIQWTCTASLPPEFRLGSTEVICEGFNSPNDPYVLKGSCGVEYKLMLTSVGLKRYGKRGDTHESATGAWSDTIFYLVLTFIVAVIAKGVWDNCQGRARGQWRRPGPRGGGDGGNDNGGMDPPPPYSRRPPSTKPKSTSSKSGQANPLASNAASAAAGAAAGYFLGSRNSNSRQNDPQIGSSRSAEEQRSSLNNQEPSSSARYESTGFGGTRRR